MIRRKEPDFTTTLNAALMEGHRAFLRFLSRRTTNRADAEDILQDFYLKVVQSSQAIRNRGALRFWLATVLRRTLADHYRKLAASQRALQRLKVQEEARISEREEAERAACECLYLILPALPPQYSQIIWRIDLLGQQRSQVAKSLGISTNSLTVRVHRARQALRRALLRFCITCPEHGFLNCGCEEAGESATVRHRERSVLVRPVRKQGRNRLNDCEEESGW